MRAPKAAWKLFAAGFIITLAMLAVAVSIWFNGIYGCITDCSVTCHRKFPAQLEECIDECAMAECVGNVR